MPRITGPNIAEHVRQQEAAIVAAAARLFAQRGVANTDLGDIAEAVGLARSSLYRYFPDKDHILLRWFQIELDPVIERSRAIIEGPGSVDERLFAWLDYQVEYVTDPAHELAPLIATEIGALGPEVRHEIAAGHGRLYGTLGELVAEALAADDGSADRDPVVVAQLIAGLLQAAAQAASAGVDSSMVRRELHHGALAVLHG
jgi:AcrR family transcriptional regulator